MTKQRSSLELRTLPTSHVALLLTTALAASLVFVSRPLTQVPAFSGAGAEERALEGYGDLPISFEPNVGQASDRYDFVARGHGFGLAIDATGATLSMGTEGSHDFVRMNIVGASRSADPVALESLPGKVNYFIGNDPSRWHSDVPTSARVSYADILPGIGVTYYGTNDGSLEYDFVVAPGADPEDITLTFSGAEDVALRGGSLIVATANGEVTQHPPVLYQTIEGHRVPVTGSFTLGGDKFGFEVGPYDRRHELVIDPTLVYSTHLGGSAEDHALGIAVDSQGQAYVTGYTGSGNFPTNGTLPPFQGTSPGSFDAFVTKLDATGLGPIYSTYLGGSGDEHGEGIAIDASGGAYVAGYTDSTNYPTQTPHQGVNAGGLYDGFVTKLDATGSLDYSTFLGNTGDDVATNVAVDGTGSAYVTGYTSSATFPTPASSGPNAGGNDAFITKLGPAGSLVYSDLLGGSGDDLAWGISVDGAKAYVAGVTESSNFPMQAPFQGSAAGGSADAFVTKYDTSGSLSYSTYLGGTSDDRAWAIAVDGTGAAYVAGETSSAVFPTPGNPGSIGGNDEAFVTKLTPSGGLVYSSVWGGSNGDTAQGIAVDGSGAAYVAGATASIDFPTQIPSQPSHAGGLPFDAFVTKFNATGSGHIYSTYLGGSNNDFAQAIAIDTSGAAYVAGSAQATFPLLGQLQTYAGNGDAFVTKLADNTPATCGGQTVTIQVTSPNQTTLGTPAGDVINGTTGIDTIDGLGGNDTICGLGDDDLLTGGKDNDKLLGAAGTDTLNGDVGSDSLRGGLGPDKLSGDPGDDFLSGDPGNDLLRGTTGDDSLKGAAGNDVLSGGADTDACDGGGGSDSGTFCEFITSIP
jgi:Ca2+-binding RTX toxin-like protein